MIGIKQYFRWAGCVVLLAGVLGASGCAFIGLGAQVFESPIKAEYRLPDRSTVVLVDDPQRQLGSPSMATLLAEQLSSNLLVEKAVSHVISPHEIDAYLLSLGDRAGSAGIDQIGRAVNAELVVYVYVDSATLFPEPGLLQPNAAVHVKVIDASNRRRLFPSAGEAESEPSAMLTPRGRQVQVKMGATGADAESPVMRNAAFAQLTRRIARDVSWVFVDHARRQPGEPFD